MGADVRRPPVVIRRFRRRFRRTTQGLTPGYVYAILNMETGRFKIGGTARTPTERMRDFQTGSDAPLTVLSAWWAPHWPALERLMHRILADRHHRGEWYSINLADAHRAYELATGHRGYRYWRARVLGELRLSWLAASRWVVRGLAAVGAIAVGAVSVWLAVLVGLDIL